MPLNSDVESSNDAAKTCLVIGAGAAGVSCASLLHENGVRVILLEASNRIGGRCFTSKVGDNKHDLGVWEHGATWLHGVVGNPAFELCDSLGLVPKGQMAVREAKNGNSAAIAQRTKQRYSSQWRAVNGVALAAGRDR